MAFATGGALPTANPAPEAPAAAWRRDAMSTWRRWSRAAVIEAFAFIVLLFVYIWWIEPRTHGKADMLVRVLIGGIPLVSCLAHGDRPRDVGLRLDNFSRSAREVGVATLIGIGAILAVGAATGSSPRFGTHTITKLCSYPLWALWQQYALQAYVHRRLAGHMGRPKAAGVIAAVLFGAVHLPNPSLLAASLLGALVWCPLYARNPNLLTLAVSHGWLGTLVSVTLPPEWVNAMRFGPRFWLPG